MRSPVAATAGSRRTASVPKLPGPGAPRAKLRQSAALLTAPCLSLPATGQQRSSSSSAAQPGNTRAGGRGPTRPPIGPPAPPKANRCPQRPQKQPARSPKRAHKTAARRTARTGTPTSWPRGPQTSRMRRQSHMRNGEKIPGGPQSELTAD
ncbi:hypothetical protein NDU88_005304 [Pleurodeles waltl]|uniref:Uncharacterized protein n=1 Tax=Pleurodeles waltl TaxID=8319 RepID=A0AAV7NNN9_PLEWA|nr:hypothetical protein NDU88_005304 [Pleurodeles waltl]